MPSFGPRYRRGPKYASGMSKTLHDGIMEDLKLGKHVYGNAHIKSDYIVSTKALAPVQIWPGLGIYYPRVYQYRLAKTRALNDYGPVPPDVAADPYDPAYESK
jgi:hypothetical protein